ncbi:MAG TPA: hypothetical protein DIC52_15010 [Candidatus Latescibacteria bacterium]|nr:hypothetical protein [Candidatus Latescibacterota bacterium]
MSKPHQGQGHGADILHQGGGGDLAASQGQFAMQIQTHFSEALCRRHWQSHLLLIGAPATAFDHLFLAAAAAVVGDDRIAQYQTPAIHRIHGMTKGLGNSLAIEYGRRIVRIGWTGEQWTQPGILDLVDVTTRDVTGAEPIFILDRVEQGQTQFIISQLEQ